VFQTLPATEKLLTALEFVHAVNNVPLFLPIRYVLRASTAAAFSPAPFTTGTPLADALFLLANRAILPVTVLPKPFTHVDPTSSKLFAASINCSGTLIALLAIHPVRYPMMYEVLIPTTVAAVLLPFNFWSTAEIVLWVAMVTVFWERRDAILAGLSLRPVGSTR
jgi:hypothetical protein